MTEKMPGAIRLHYPRLAGIIWLAALLTLFFSPITPALAGSQGSYVFQDPETGKAITVWYAKPRMSSSDTPVVMVLHGQNRNADTYRNVWASYVDQYGFIALAPEFSEEIFPGNSYEQGHYFSVTPSEARKNKTRPVKHSPSEWSFRVPDKIFSHYAAQNALATPNYYLYGHSAGAQFIHRMLQVLPENGAKMAVAANAGWYTLPDTTDSWPYGLKEAEIGPGDIRRFLAFPLVVMVGENDTDPRHPGLRRTAKADRQGLTRLARGKYFYNFCSDLARVLNVPFGWRFYVVPDAAHSNKEMAGSAAAFIGNDIAVNKY